MKKIFSYILLALPLFTLNLVAFTDEEIRSISERLESYSTNELLERREIILAALDSSDCENPGEVRDKAGECVASENEEESEEKEENTAPIVSPRSNTSLLLELSIIEQLLILSGVVLVDAISDDTSVPPDTVFPVISINGDNPATVELGSTYNDPGAVSDDGSPIIVLSNDVNTNVVGSYSIVYSATDLAGNTTTATRTVNVVDTTAPVITVTGDNPATVELGDGYTDAGATATDLDTVTVTSASDVDTDTVGSYTVTYTATDASGNTATATRTVNVVDTTDPVLTVTGDATVTVELGDAYVDAGATATDLDTVTV